MLLRYSKNSKGAVTSCVSVIWEKDYRFRVQVILAQDAKPQF